MRSVLIFLGIFLLAGFFAWSVWSGVQSGSREAAILEAIEAGQPTPTTFPEPQLVSWEGHVTRTLAGGRGIEVRSVAAEGGWFFAYRADDALIEQTEGSVLVTGLWQGISCEYGRCAPEVEIQSIELLPVVPE
ncbi:MAG TPA: hypothetical protein VJ553_06990 [Candidatus Paceibacterota bacterium]|nr:hypothetical protein [Candidatus Paceibacterota bacterium]